MCVFYGKYLCIGLTRMSLLINCYYGSINSKLNILFPFDDKKRWRQQPFQTFSFHHPHFFFKFPYKKLCFLLKRKEKCAIFLTLLDSFNSFIFLRLFFVVWSPEIIVRWICVHFLFNLIAWTFYIFVYFYT